MAYVSIRWWHTHYFALFSPNLAILPLNHSIRRVLQNSMSASYDDVGPIANYRMEMAIFYIVYFIVFPFFFVNIFVALIIITFQEQGEAELQDGGIDKNQVRNIQFDQTQIFIEFIWQTTRKQRFLPVQYRNHVSILPSMQDHLQHTYLPKTTHLSIKFGKWSYRPHSIILSCCSLCWIRCYLWWR